MTEMHVRVFFPPFLSPFADDCRDGKGTADTDSSLSLELYEMMALRRAVTNYIFPIATECFYCLDRSKYTFFLYLNTVLAQVVLG